MEIITLIQSAKEFSERSSPDYYQSINYLNKALNSLNENDSTLKYFIFKEIIEILELEPSIESSLTIPPLEMLSQLSQNGDDQSQFILASIYGTGVYTGLVPMDAGRSLLLTQSSAMSGDYLANMAMGYRHLYGIGVPESCEHAIKHYELSANEAARAIESRGYALFSDKSYLYNIKMKSREIDEELVDFYTHLSNEGDATAALSLAVMHMTGSKLLPQSYSKAIDCLYTASLSTNRQNAAAVALLGYLLVLGFKPSNPLPITIKEIVDRLHAIKDPVASTALGYAYYQGIGVHVNITRAVELLQSAAGKHTDAGYYLGEIFMGRGIPDGFEGPKIDMSAALQYYRTSSQKGNVLALHRVGVMASLGLGGPRHCASAVNSFKSVSERGDWMTKLTTANKLYSIGNSAAAVIIFTRFAFIGVEVAQANAAHILSKSYCPSWMQLSDNYNQSTLYLVPRSDWIEAISFNITNNNTSLPTNDSIQLSNYRTSVHCDLRSLQFYSLSSDQRNSDSYIRIGDLYYYGLAGLSPNKPEAAVFYQKSADLKLTHAIFNLALMYQFGDGIQQDFHLAKRYYDQAADYDIDARLPRSIALLGMSIHKCLLNVMGQENFQLVFKSIYPHILSIYRLISHLLTITNQFKYNNKQRGSNTSSEWLKILFKYSKESLRLIDRTLDGIISVCNVCVNSFLSVLSWYIGWKITQRHMYNYISKFLTDFVASDVITLENYLLLGLTVLLMYLIDILRRRRIN